MSSPETEAPDGKKIHWQCQKCGNCCRWPGEVVVSSQEIQDIAEFIEMDLYDFTREYTTLRLNRSGLTLIEKDNHECIFLNEKGLCDINPVKPHQCRGFPNTWNFEGWQEVCEAKPILIETERK